MESLDQATVGRFFHNSTAIFHCDESLNLLKGQTIRKSAGREKHMFGINNFGLRINKLYERVIADDPYADMILMDLEIMLQSAQELLEKLSKRIGQLELNLPSNQKVSTLESKQPFTLSLNDPKVFTTPYSYMAIRILSQFDLFLRRLKTLKEHGLIKKKHYWDIHYQTSESLRSIFQKPYEYQDFGISRSDIKSKTDKGNQAIAQLGELPLEVINGEKTNEYGPTPTPLIKH